MAQDTDWQIGVELDTDRTSKSIEAYGDRFKTLAKKVTEAFDGVDSD